MPGVKDVMISQWFGGVYKDAARSQELLCALRRGAGKAFHRASARLKIPEDQKQAFIHERTGVHGRPALAKKLNFHLGDRITLTGDIFRCNLELTVRGDLR